MDQEQPAASGSKAVSRVASSVHDVMAEKPPFGSRFLTDKVDVWSQNAWDHVPPPNDQDEIIAAALAKQHIAPVPEDDRAKYFEKPAKHWDNFYKMNANNFFRNRNWLHLEFPELPKAAEPEAGKLSIAEIGCGAGNAIFPLLGANKNPDLSLYAFDYSSHAVKLVQANPLYQSPPIGTIQAAVWDLSSASLPQNISEGSIDIIVLIFVFSALHPHEWQQAISNIHKLLKPGGLVLFRDYGRYDLTQLRFKAGRLLEDNFYIRGDKTRVYFFELDELSLLFTGSPLPPLFQTTNSETTVEEDESGAQEVVDTPPDVTRSSSSAPSTLNMNARASPGPSSPKPYTPIIHPSLRNSSEATPSLPHPLFAIEQLGVDRRLIVNRKRQLKMYRVWMQGKFRKL